MNDYATILLILDTDMQSVINHAICKEMML